MLDSNLTLNPTRFNTVFLATVPSLYLLKILLDYEMAPMSWQPYLHDIVFYIFAIKEDEADF